MTWLDDPRALAVIALLLIAGLACGSQHASAPESRPEPLLANEEGYDATPPDPDPEPDLVPLRQDQWCGGIAEARAADAYYRDDPNRCPERVELGGGGAPLYYWCLWDPDSELARARTSAAQQTMCCYQRDPTACQEFPRSAR